MREGRRETGDRDARAAAGVCGCGDLNSVSTVDSLARPENESDSLFRTLISQLSQRSTLDRSSSYYLDMSTEVISE